MKKLPPPPPSPSRRNTKVALTQAEVDEILLLIPQGTSVAAILRKLGMHRTTFDRVLSRDHGIIIETHVVARELTKERKILAQGAERSQPVQPEDAKQSTGAVQQ